MKKLFVFGNEYLENDSMAVQIAKELNNIEIVHCRNPDDLIEEDGDLLILDVIKGAKKTRIIENIDEIKTRNILSLHDFDLGFFLKLMEELGTPKKVRIIGIPEKGNIDEIAMEVKACL